MLALAELSRERAILGLGTGHPIGVEGGHGVKLDRPLTAMREYVEIVRLLVREREFRYEGQVYNVPRYAGTSRSYFEDHPFRIPIFVAALRSRMARLAGEVADGVLMNLATPRRIRRGAEIVRKAAKEAGRDPGEVTIGALVAVSVSQNEGAATEAVRLAVANYVTLMPFYKQDAPRKRLHRRDGCDCARGGAAGRGRRSQETSRGDAAFPGRLRPVPTMPARPCCL